MVLKVALYVKCLTAETSARTFREVIRLSSGKKEGCSVGRGVEFRDEA